MSVTPCRRARLYGLVPFILLSAIAIAFWIPAIFDDNFLIWNDATVYLNPQKEFDTNFYAWLDRDLGSPNSVSSHLPLLVPILVLYSAGIPVLALNHLFMAATVAVAGWTMYYILSRLLPGKHRGISAIMGSTFYMLAPVASQGALGTVEAVSYSIFPLFFYFLYKGLQAEKGRALHFATLAGLASLGVGIAPQVASLSIITGFLLLCGTLVARRTVNLRFLILVVAIGFAINASWLVPLFSDSERIFGEFSTDVTGHHLGETSRASDILLSIRLMDFSHFGVIDLGAVGIIMWLIPAYCFSAIFLARRKLVYFLAGLAIISVLFSTGIKYPTGAIYLAITQYIPYLFVPLQTLTEYLFLAAFCYAVLFAFATHALATQITDKIAKSAFACLALVLLSAGSYFSIVGELSQKDQVVQGFASVGRQKLSTLNHKPGADIPPAYFDLAKMSRSDEDAGYRLLVLPWQQGYLKYDWYKYADMVDIVHRISPVPTTGYYYSFLPHDLDILKSKMLSGNLTEIAAQKDVLAGMSIRYVLVHKDLEKGPANNISVQVNLASEGKSYSITNSTATSATSYDVNRAAAEALGGRVMTDNEAYTLFALDGTLPAISAQQTSDIGFAKHSPVYYSGSFENTVPIQLILRESYDSGWQLKLDGKAVSDEKHFADGYANGWTVDAPGRHDFDIYYKRQDVHMCSAALSLATFALAAGIPAAALVKKRDRIKRSSVEKKA